MATSGAALHGGRGVLRLRGVLPRSYSGQSLLVFPYSGGSGGPRNQLRANLGNAISWHSFSRCKSPENINELVIEHVPSMSILIPILMHMCGRPRGLLCSLDGHVMPETNEE